MKTYWPYVITAYLSLFALGHLDNIRGPFFPDITRDLQLTDFQASFFFAVTSFIAFVANHYARFLLPFLGSLGGLRLGLLIMFLGFFWISQVTHFSELLIACSLFGLGFGVSGVFQHTNISEGADIQYRRQFFSGLHMMYALSALLAPLLVAQYLEWEWTWRKSFLVVSFLPLVILGISFFWKSKPIQQAHEHSARIERSILFSLIYTSLFMAVYVAAELSISTRLVLYVQRVWKEDAIHSTYYLTLFFLLLFVGRLTFTIFPVHNISNFKILTTSLIASLIFYMCGLQWSPWYLSLCGLTMSPFFAMGMDYLNEVFPKHGTAAMSYGLALSSLVVVIMHFTMGAVTEFMGIQKAMYMGPFLLMGSLFILFTHKKNLSTTHT